MSLLDQIYATPSRVEGIVRLLASTQKRSMPRDAVEQTLSPDALIGIDVDPDAGRRLMIRAAIQECVRLQLVRDEGGVLVLAEDVPARVVAPIAMSACLPGIILERILADQKEGNHDLVLALAWYLGHPVLSAPGTWPEFQKELATRGAVETLRFNDNKFFMFLYWARYLGFARVLPDFARNSERIAPDPTVVLKRLLPEIFVALSSTTLPIQDLVLQLSKRCPVLDGGTARAVTDGYLPMREAKHLSSTTSHAFFFLEEAGTLRLNLKSDAAAMVLVDGHRRRQVSEIAWLASEHSA